MVWAIKDKSIGHAFFDEGAATFFLPHLETPHHSAESAAGKPAEAKPLKRTKYVLDSVGGCGVPCCIAYCRFMYIITTPIALSLYA